MVERMKTRPTSAYRLVGKYVEYRTPTEPQGSAAARRLAHGVKVNISWWKPRNCRADLEARLGGYDGILVPGGFGKRGIDGMIEAIRYARENQVPYFGICLGMQTLVIEFARHVCGMEQAIQRIQPGGPVPGYFKLRELKGVDELAAPCGWAPIPAAWRREASRATRTARPRSASATATATSSTASLKAFSSSAACASRPDSGGTYVEICEIPTTHGPRLPVPSRVQVQPLEPHPLFRAFIGAAHKLRKGRQHVAAYSHAD